MSWAVEEFFLKLNLGKDKGFFCSVKNFIDLVCVTFSSILSILDRREMGL